MLYYYVFQWNWDLDDTIHHEQLNSHAELVSRIKELYSYNRNVEFTFYKVECESINVPSDFWSKS